MRSYPLKPQKTSTVLKKGSKAFLRSFYSEKISQIPPLLKKQKEQQIVSFLQSLTFFKFAKHIAVYKALKDEPCLSLFYKSLGPKLCWPVIKKDRLEFYKNPKNRWQKNSLKVLEPLATAKHYIPLQQISVFLIPGRAFDRSGGRLGRGQGFYDKSLADLKKEGGFNLLLNKGKPINKASQALFIGVAFTEQIQSQLKLLSHDVLMDIILTDSFVLYPLRDLKKMVN